ncbi:uncharacterized protein [Linepithema humile]|uniref:uncharacterized protein isoform X2 n=1 Tax=Linepithema humile TaxID=83485 RepID=UPI00062390DF|nr:PREDICTED: uncharacterized protein LOC105671470 isoform X2 [Linepithema humile]
MPERVNAIHKYYTDLEYDKKWNNDVFINVSTLSEEMTFEDVNDFAERFLKAASVIEKNLSDFKSRCSHVDDVTTIIEYLTNFGMQFVFGNFFDKEYTSHDVVLSVMLTLFSMCSDPEVQLFLKNAIIKNSTLNSTDAFDKFDNIFLNSDLYAAISYLRIKSAKNCLNDIIWIHRSIQEKALWLIEKYFKNQNIPIHIFSGSCQPTEKLLTPTISNVTSMISLWSENLATAKNVAALLNKDVVFINTYMDFSGGVVLLPYVKIFSRTLPYKCSLGICPLKSDAYSTNDIFRNLFYDGTWQQPVKGTYWIYDNHGTYNELWANATSDDINRCINSAEKGFKIWSAKSTEARMQILLKFVSLLECNRKFLLANKVLKLVKFLCTYEKSLSCTQNGRLEVTRIRKPRGVIVIKELDENVLLYRVIASLFAGNSVIVICGIQACSLICNLSYCDLFSMSNVPPGVVNLLSNENTKTLESILCKKDYESYAKQFFTEDDLSTFTNLTLPKQIIFSFK